MNSTDLVKFDGNRFYWEINVDSRSDSVKPGRDLADNFMTQQFDLGVNKRRIFAWDGEKYTTYFLPANNAIVDAGGNSPHPVNGPLTAGDSSMGIWSLHLRLSLCVDSSGIESTASGRYKNSFDSPTNGWERKSLYTGPDKELCVRKLLDRKTGRFDSFTTVFGLCTCRRQLGSENHPYRTI